MSLKTLKIVGFIVTLVGGAASLLSDYIDDIQTEERTREIVREELDKKEEESE